MDGVVRAILVVGLLNAIALGLIACGDDSRADATLANRVAELEAWKLSVEQRLVRHHNGSVSQNALNREIEASMISARDHAIRLDESLQSQRDALQQIAEIVKDLLRRK